jgi:hypothetical protein
MEIVEPPFHRRAETDKLMERFSELAPDEVIDYREVEKLIGEDPQAPIGRSITQSARNGVLREDHIYIECLRKIGFQRTTEPAKIDVSNRQINKVRSAVRRGAKVIKSIDSTQLNGEEQKQYTITVAWYGALSQATRRSLKKQICSALDSTSNVKSSESFLKLMIERKGG